MTDFFFFLTTCLDPHDLEADDACWPCIITERLTGGVCEGARNLVLVALERDREWLGLTCGIAQNVQQFLANFVLCGTYCRR